MSQYTFSDRDQFSLKHQQVCGSNEPIFKLSDPANVAKSLLNGNRDQARSELMKQIRKVEYVNNCTNELQQQTYAQIRSMHEMGEVKRAQELRVDEFSVQKWRESHDTIQRLTLQEQMNSMNDSGEFQGVESNYSGRMSYVSSQPAMIPSSHSMLSCDKRLPLDTWDLSVGHRESFLAIHVLCSVITNTLSRNSSLYDTKCYRCGSSACLYRDRCGKR